MLVTRRGFLGVILATGVAPAIVRADALMRIVPRDTVLLTPDRLVEPQAPGEVRMRVPILIGAPMAWESETQPPQFSTIEFSGPTLRDVERQIAEYKAKVRRHLRHANGPVLT